MTRTALAAMAAVAMVIAPACGADSGGESGAGVDWTKYDASVKERIDSLAASSDCAGLQGEFDTAAENDEATRNRTGEGNADLMAYIDDALREAGCYD